MGHEMTGRVARLGAHVTTDAAGAPLREGDRVVYRTSIRAGAASSAAPVTRTTASRGASEPAVRRATRRPTFTGAFADYYYLQPGHYVLRTPDALDDFTVAPLNCALAQVIYGPSPGRVPAR